MNRKSTQLLATTVLRASLGVLLLSTSTPAAQQQVLEVSVGDDLPAAAANAPAGAILLIEDGFYPGTIVVDQALSLIAENDGEVQIEALNIHDLPAGSTVLARGLESIFDVQYFAPGGLRLADCAGNVQIEACVFWGPLDNHFAPTPYVLIERCSAVVVIDSSLRGGAEGTFGTTDPGLRAADSRINLFNSSVQGADAPGGLGLDGSVAAELVDSSLFAQDCQILGGQGVFIVNPFGCGPAGSGGDGIAHSGTRKVRLRNTSPAGGSAGAPDCLGGVVGSQGVPYTGDPSRLEIVASPVTGLTLSPSPLRSGAQASIQVTGSPGHTAIVLYALEGGAKFLSNSFSVLALGGPVFPLGTVTLDAGGVASLTLNVNLPANIPGLSFTMQAVSFLPMAPGTKIFGPPTAGAVVH